jgi:subtilisin
MARQRASTRASAEQGSGSESAHRQGMIENLVRTGLTQGTTGRFLVVYRDEELKAGVKAMRDLAGVETISTADFSEGVVPHDQVNGEQILLANLGIGITTADPDQLHRVSLSSADSPIELVVPEGVVFLSTGLPGAALPVMPGFPMPGLPGAGGGWSLDYLRGYHDALGLLLQAYGGAPPASAFPPSTFTPAPFGVSDFVGQAQADLSAFADETEATWGLQACNVPHSRLTGRDVKVAILDTGLDLQHPDFQDGRVTKTQSFVGPFGDAMVDRDPSGRFPGNPGHGTHCTGTACGPKEPSNGPRYGVACKALIYSGKVFLNNGSTVDGAIVEGISWAISQECKVVSMSFGSPVQGPNPDPTFEKLGKRAMRQGTVLIAAAGNRSDRRVGKTAPVDSPANAGSILAVGAVDSNMQVAFFSNRGRFPPGGAVDVVGPGVAIYSSQPRPKLHGKLMGTSQATPHVAGIAALIAEAEPEWEAFRIMNFLINTARKLSGDSRDLGSGLVQAP